MLKKVLILALLLNLGVMAEDSIKAGIYYNEATARVEAFKDVQKKIDRDFLKDHLKDKNRKENLYSIENKQLIIGTDRELYPFYLKKSMISYAVTYYNNPEMTFYYNILGNLVKFDIKKGDDFPKKSIGYTRFGALTSVAFEVSDKEQFVYDENGKLIAHWVENKLTNSTKSDKLLNKLEFRRGLEEK